MLDILQAYFENEAISLRLAKGRDSEGRGQQREGEMGRRNSD